jgi:hypothetical protein
MKHSQIDTYIRLFFFDPSKSRDEYIESYKILLKERFDQENVYRYSPLFLLLKDIRYCFGIGKEFNLVRDQIRPPESAGIILIDVAFRNVVRKIYDGDFEDFGKTYMGITTVAQLEGFRHLRNALEHGFYGLQTYDKKTKSDIYFRLSYGSHFIEKYPSVDPSKVIFNVNPRKLLLAFMKGIGLFREDLLKPDCSKRKNFSHFVNIDKWIFIK